MAVRISTYALFLGFSAAFLTLPTACYGPMAPQGLLRNIQESYLGSAASPPAFTDLSLSNFADSHFRSVRRYSRLYGVDYRLILAIIKQESQFDEEALSERGARGLMQIMPLTVCQLRRELDLTDAELPTENIRAGIYYYSKLYSNFRGARSKDRLRFALASYNAGPGRIYDAQVLAAYIGENPESWSSIQNVLPLLSKRYYSLHQAVWLSGRPPSGYFGESRQTIDYVSSVLKTYAAYQSNM